jgi:hypothetical protein
VHGSDSAENAKIEINFFFKNWFYLKILTIDSE